MKPIIDIYQFVNHHSGNTDTTATAHYEEDSAAVIKPDAAENGYFLIIYNCVRLYTP
jgi:hypothetical protein